MTGEMAHIFSLLLTRASLMPGTEMMGRTLATGLLGAIRMVLEDAIASSTPGAGRESSIRSEEHTSELQSRLHLVCRLLLAKQKKSRRSRCDFRGLSRPNQTPGCDRATRPV